MIKKYLLKGMEHDSNHVILSMLVYGNMELIVVHKDSVKDKREYIDLTYDDNLFMKVNKNIEIVGFSFHSNVDKLAENVKNKMSLPEWRKKK